MNIILFTKSKKDLPLCEYLKNSLCQNSIKSSIILSDKEFFYDVMDEDSKTDLYVIDCKCFNDPSFNIHEYLIENYDCYVPVIYFNNKNSKSKTKSWKNFLSFVYNVNFQALDKYSKTFDILEKALLNFEKENKLPDKNESLEKINDKNLYSIIKSDYYKNLSSSAYIIFRELFYRKEQNVSIEDLKLKIQKNNHKPKESTVSCLISEIRIMLRKHKENPFKIIKSKDSYKLIEL